MKHTSIPLIFLALLLIISCKSEKKVTTYEELYKEQPFTILIVPTHDNTKRPQEKSTQDRVLNEELDMAATFLQQSCVEPLVSQGYYAIPPLAGNTILEKYGKTYRQLMLDNITDLNNQYGVDAILLVANPIELAADLAFIKTTEMKPRLAHRCLLLQGMSDFALRNMPTSASRWMFKQDQYTSANPNFYSFLMNTDGSIEREKYNEDAFGNECFTD